MRWVGPFDADRDTSGALAVVMLVVTSALMAIDAGETVPVGALLLALGFAAAAISPIGAAAYTLAVVPFAFHLHPLPGGSFSLLELGIVWTVGAIGIRLVLSPRQLPRRIATAVTRYPWITVAAAVLIVAALASIRRLPPDAHHAEALRELRLVVLEPIAFVAALIILDLRRNGAAWLVGGLVAGGVVASAGALMQLFDADAGVIADNVTRLTGPYSHPNNLSLYLERIAAFAVPFAIMLSGRRRVVIATSMGAMLLALVLTYSRGGWLGMAAALVVILVVLQRYRLLALMGVAGLVAAVPAGVLLRERIMDLGGASDEPTRFAIWRSSWDMILDHPWTGVGPDQFLYQYGRRYVEPIGWPERYTSHPHNAILDFAVRLGAGGLAALATMVGAVIDAAVSGFRELRSDPVRLGAFAALVAGAVHGMIDNSFFLPDLAVLFWTFLVLLSIAPDSTASSEVAA